MPSDEDTSEEEELLEDGDSESSGLPDGADMTRRDFLTLTMAAAGAAALGFGGGLLTANVDDGYQPGERPEVDTQLQEYPRLRIASLSELQVGTPVTFRYPLEHDNMDNMIIKLGTTADGGVGPDGDIVAFNYMCTHMGCPLIGLYKSSNHILGPCGCHYTTFDLRKRGLVTLGQATENLPQVLLEVDGDDIYAVGLNGLVYGFRDNLRDAEPVEGAL